MRSGTVKHIVTYYGGIPEAIKLLKRERDALEDEYNGLDVYKRQSIHRDYCGCAWGNVRMNCDSEQLRALALFCLLYTSRCV